MPGCAMPWRRSATRWPTLGQAPDDAQAELTALFAHIVGLLLLSHTGRIRMFRQASDDLFGRYLDRLIDRLAPNDHPEPA